MAIESLPDNMKDKVSILDVAFVEVTVVKCNISKNIEE